MENKYIATIMNRSFLIADNYLFSFRNVVLGNYNEKTKIFTDEYGNEYFYMMSGNALTMDVPYAAYNIMKIEDLKKASKSKNIKKETIINEYVKKVEEKIYIVGYTDDYTPYLEVVNLDIIKNEANQKHMNDSNVLEDPTITRLEQLILDTVDGKYSKEQLLTMKDNLENIKDTMENVIGTMETKIEAIENNKSFKEYLTEQIANPIDVVKPESPKLLPPTRATHQDTTDTKTNQDKLKEDLIKKYKIEPKKKDESIIMKQQKKIEKINIEEVYKNVTKTLIAQDEPAYRVIVEIARKEMSPSKKREAILLTGPTGVGKTELMRQISIHMNRPLLIVDSTQITTPGYTGKDITEILWDLYVKCGKNKEKTEQAIIYFDEIDKKGSEKNDDVNAKGVLNELLPFIEGTTYDAALDSKSSTQIVKIDTSNMIVILGGAFSDVQKHLIETNTIGFGTDKNSLDNPKYRQATTEDFVKYGNMTNEFMGRVVIVPLNALGKEDIRRVMLESNQSALRKQEQIFKDLGVKLTYTSSYVDKVVDKAFALKTGARSLNGIIDKSTWKAFAEVYTHEDIYSELILDEESVEDSSNYQLVKKRKTKK